MHRFKLAVLFVFLLSIMLLLGGCNATITPDQITIDVLYALIASWGILGIVLAILGAILGFLWMLMPFFVWRVASYNKRIAARSLKISNTLARLESLAIRMEMQTPPRESSN